MCGIAGIFSPSGRLAGELGRHAALMAEALAHRGPDDSGVWADEARGIALGHRRLSILDPSPVGRQPMMSHSGRLVMTYNGEIYNHLELRESLAGAGWSFRTGTDTETLLCSFEQWGIAETLKRADGMFALAVWDASRRELTLARDRLGEKPLYYALCGGAFAFGSELRALRALPGFDMGLDPAALHQYFRHGCVPAPLTIHTGTRKLLPGTMITMREPNAAPVEQAYWSAEDAYVEGANAPFSGDETEAKQELMRLLEQSIRSRMLSDVPLGAFLSGGIDSSIVVSLMQGLSASPVKTFTIGFSEEAYNEAPYAKAIAQRLGCDHTELIVTPGDLMDCARALAQTWDEPFADSSQVPTLLLCRLARSSVTVALSGDGGDELFLGYGRYQVLAGGQVHAAPPALRAAAGGLARLLPGSRRPLVGSAPWKLRWRLDFLTFQNRMDRYDYLTSIMRHPEDLVGGPPRPAGGYPISREPGLGEFQDMSLRDATRYLPDDILVKLDRASMSCGLEARAPFLDPKIVSFAASLPVGMKIHQGTGKHILRQALYDKLPRQLVDRPKKGFAIPIGEWLRGPLRGWAQDLLFSTELCAGLDLNRAELRRIWTEHDGRHYDRSAEIWCALMLLSWAERLRTMPASGRPS